MKRLIALVILLFSGVIFGQKCVLWNKLQDLNCRSIIGLNGAITGAVDFAPCKFGNGVRSDANGEYVKFEFNMNLNATTFEFWIKPDFNLINGIAGDELQHVFTDTYISSPDIVFQIGVINNAGSEGIWIRYDTINLATGTGENWTAGDLVHIAVSMDISKTIDGTKSIAVYRDGIQRVSRTNDIVALTSKGIIVGAHNGSFTLPSKAYIDNIKVWNYAKTDFSDRHKEAFRQTGKYQQ